MDPYNQTLPSEIAISLLEIKLLHRKTLFLASLGRNSKIFRKSVLKSLEVVFYRNILTRIFETIPDFNQRVPRSAESRRNRCITVHLIKPESTNFFWIIYQTFVADLLVVLEVAIAKKSIRILQKAFSYLLKGK